MKDSRNRFPMLASAILSLLLLQDETQAFTIKLTAHQLKTSSVAKCSSWNQSVPRETAATYRSESRLSMYNLPQGGGGGGKNELSDIVKGVVGLALVVGFFASPVGGFVLGIFNSFLLLALLLPALATVGFQAWQYFNTIEGNCPNCDAPIKVFKTSKEGDAVPTICYNCGAILQANYENTGIDNVTGRKSVIDDDSSPFGNGSAFDIFGAGPTATSSTTSTETYTVIEDDKPKKSKPRIDSGGIIDAEIEDDKPFQ